MKDKKRKILETLHKFKLKGIDGKGVINTAHIISEDDFSALAQALTKIT